ncbi:hypothetical protein DPEC_G00349110 [Dallia pectoralis]|uniref:Uncharacterized protein n=1 Tax=Dallia pectoralis TaxID=75939 RepID=A0ACC2F1C1_DALPE|nr:hypothetical protein DPEC_G00349110 [Dallia pectoralis]
MSPIHFPASAYGGPLSSTAEAEVMQFVGTSRHLSPTAHPTVGRAGNKRRRARAERYTEVHSFTRVARPHTSTGPNKRTHASPTRSAQEMIDDFGDEEIISYLLLLHPHTPSAWWTCPPRPSPDPDQGPIQACHWPASHVYHRMMDGVGGHDPHSPEFTHLISAADTSNRQRRTS